MGSSDCGIISLNIAINYPERLHKFITYGANYNFSGVRAAVDENETFNAYIAKESEDHKKLLPVLSQWDSFLQNVSNMCSSEPNFTPEQLDNITVPILVQDGDNSEAI